MPALVLVQESKRIFRRLLGLQWDMDMGESNIFSSDARSSLTSVGSKKLLKSILFYTIRRKTTSGAGDGGE